MNLFPNKIKSEKGAIIVLFVFLLIPLIIVISLALDSSRLAITQSEMKRVSGSMALGAIESFLRTPGAVYEDKVSAARARAAEIGALATNTPLGTPNTAFVLDPEVIEIDYGRWWFEDLAAPLDCATTNGTGGCPCESGAFVGPCLQVLTGDANINNINAARVRIESHPDPIDRVASIFGSLINMSNVSLNATTTASVVPRNGVFLIDLSRSMQFDTHLPYERQTNKSLSSEYAFRLANGYSCANYPGPTPANATCNMAQIAADCANRFSYITDATTRNERINVCTNCPPIEPFDAHRTWHTLMDDSGTSSSVTKHYRNDYTCVDIAIPASVSGTPAHTESYLVESNVPAAKRPEPLNTVLTGVNSALQSITERSIAGDSVTFIAFDNDHFAPGSTVRTFGPTQRGTAQFNALQAITSPTASEASRINSFIFPGAGAGRGETDISSVLLTAKSILTQLPNFGVAENFVVLFSDGMATCSHRVAGCMMSNAGALGTSFCLSGTPSNASNRVNVPPTGAGVNYTGIEMFMASLKETTQVVSRRSGFGNFDTDNRHALLRTPTGVCSSRTHNEPSFFDLGIRFHYFAIGDAVRPYTLLQRSAVDPTRCASSNEFLDLAPDTSSLGKSSELFAQLSGILNGVSCVTPVNDPQGLCPAWNTSNSWGDGTNPSRVYSEGHQMMYAYGVHPTRGIYQPVRRPCNTVPGATVNASCEVGGNSLESVFDAACAANPTPALAGIAPYVNTPVSTPTRRMLICDPTCKSQAAQVTEGINKIYGENPFLIVQ